jgi:hypothetical protein
VLGRGLIPRGPQDDLKGKDPPAEGTKAPTRNILERKALRLASRGCAVVGKDRGVAPRLHQTPNRIRTTILPESFGYPSVILRSLIGNSFVLPRNNRRITEE